MVKKFRALEINPKIAKGMVHMSKKRMKMADSGIAKMSENIAKRTIKR